MIEPFVTKYAPKSKKDLIGNIAEIEKIDQFLKNWGKKGSPKAILLVGPPGIGKTTSVYALANDHGVDVIEFNASDNRNKSDLLSFVQPLTEYGNIFSDRGKIVLIDEVDGLSGQKDRGAVPTLKKLIKDTKYPIILCANDIESDKVQQLAKDIPLVLFSRPDEFTIMELLENVAEKEGIEISDDDLQIIAESAAGDIRAALNELQSFKYGTGSSYIPPSRNKMKSWVDFFNGIFFARTVDEAVAATSNSPTSDYQLILNFMVDLTHRFCDTPDERAKAYWLLANADLILNRIYATGDWGLLRYFFDIIGPEIRRIRKRTTGKRLKVLNKLPNAYFARGRGSMVNKLANELALVVAPKLHVGRNEFIHTEFHYFLKMMTGKMGAMIAASLDLDDDLVDKIVKYKKDDSMLKYLDEARKEIGKYRIQQGIKTEKKPKEDAIAHLLSSRIFEEPPSKQSKKKKKKKSKASSKQTEEASDKNNQEQKPKDQASLDDFF